MKTITVVAAILNRNHQIFATKRGYGEFESGWEFPGGKVEVGETNEEALIREIREELETEISIDRFLHTVEYDYPAFHLTMHCYLCEVVSGDLKLLEHKASRWLTKEELGEVDWLPADLELIEILKNSCL